LEPHFIEKKVRAKGAKPQKIAHWNSFWALSPTETEFHKVVSPQWKDAVESLEPGVHEFFPFTIEFDRPEGENIYAAFVMRERIWIRDREFEVLDWRRQASNVRLKIPKELCVPEITLKFSKSAVTDRHWFRAGNHLNGDSIPIVVSKALLERLLPLIPHGSYFSPAYVAWTVKRSAMSIYLNLQPKFLKIGTGLNAGGREFVAKNGNTGTVYN
jgi:hypothetical protein